MTSIVRPIALAAGLAGAAAVSQFPEFSQQYLQRMAGALDELKVIAAAVDVSAAASGVTREQALAELDGSAFQSSLRETLAAQIARHDRLAADYARLRDAAPLQRLAQAYRFTDPDLARRTWADFRPAVPLTADGLICAGMGYLIGWGLLAAVFAGTGRLLRRRRATAAG